MIGQNWSNNYEQIVTMFFKRRVVKYIKENIKYKACIELILCFWASHTGWFEKRHLPSDTGWGLLNLVVAELVLETTLFLQGAWDQSQINQPET